MGTYESLLEFQKRDFVSGIGSVLKISASDVH